MVRKRVRAVKQKMSVLDKNVRIATYVALGVTAWMLTGVFSIVVSGMLPEEETTKEHPIKTVLVEALVEKPYDRALIVTGRSMPETVLTISAETKGTVAEVLVERGDKVKVGDILARFDMDTREASRKAAKANLKKAETLFKTAKSLNKEGYTSDTTMETREAELSAAKEALAKIEEDIHNTNITAPVDGIIEKKHLEAGDFMDIGNPAFEMIGQKSFLITAHVSQRDVSRLKVGQVAKATLANGQKISGPVRYISKYADSQTKTYDIEIETLGEAASLTINSEQIYKPIPTGMTAEIRIPTEQTKAHLIPHSALVLSDEGTLGAMYVDQNDTVNFTEVKSLEDMQHGVWIEGLPSKIKLIVRGQGSVRPGEKVKVTTLEESKTS